jgi:nitrogen regulatory protein PII
MPKLIILITEHTDKGLEIAEAWEKAGAGGVTLIETYGLHRLREKSESLELQLFVSMASVLRQIEETNQTIFTIVTDDLVDKLVEAAGEVIGDLRKPHTGVAFVIDVERTFGIKAVDQPK